MDPASIAAKIEHEQALLDLWRRNFNRVRLNVAKCDDDYIIFEGYATGLSHYHYNKWASALTKNVTLIAKHHPENRYDSNATGIYIEHDNFAQPEQIGWVPKSLNSVVAMAREVKDMVLQVEILDHFRTRDISQRLKIRIYALMDCVDTAYDADYDDDVVLKAKAKLDANSAYGATTNPYAIAGASMAGTLEQLAYNSLTKEEPTMKPLNAIVAQNVNLGTSAAFLEAGRIANNQLSQIASKKLPIMVRAYADTAMGRLLLANLALMARDHFRPNDERLGKLVNSMTVSAYQEVLQQFDIEQMIDDMINNKTIARALSKFDEVEEAAPAPKPKAAK